MKKIYLLLMAAAAIVACNKQPVADEPAANHGSYVFSINASLSGETRTDYDADGNSIPGSEGLKETDEVKEMQKYIQQVADREGQEADAAIDIPRGQTRVDAAIKAARKRVDAATND